MTKLSNGGRPMSEGSTDYILPFLACFIAGPAIALAVCIRNSKNLSCPDVRKHLRIAALAGLGVFGFSVFSMDYGLLDTMSEELGTARMIEQFKLLGLMTIAFGAIAWITELQMPAYRFRAANASAGFDFSLKAIFGMAFAGLALAITAKQLAPEGIADPLSRLFAWYL